MSEVISAMAIAAQIQAFRRQAGEALNAAAELDIQAEKERARAATLEQCAGDLAVMLKQMTKTSVGVNGTQTTAKLRYQEPGLTTDMIGMIFRQPGIGKEQMIAHLRKHERTRGTGAKMLRRAIRNKDVREDGSGKLYMTPDGEAMWSRSPLFRE